MARGAKGLPGFGSLLFEAVVRIGTGVLAFVSPASLALALREVFGVWALLVFGAGRYLEIPWIIGPYSLLYGFTLLVLALRLRQLAFEIARP